MQTFIYRRTSPLYSSFHIYQELLVPHHEFNEYDKSDFLYPTKRLAFTIAFSRKVGKTSSLSNNCADSVSVYGRVCSISTI